MASPTFLPMPDLKVTDSTFFRQRCMCIPVAAVERKAEDGIAVGPTERVTAGSAVVPS